MIRTADLEGYVLLQKAIFEKEVRLTNTSFGKGVNFAQVRFGDKADFSGVHSRSKAVPQYDGVCFARQRVGEDETFWRFIKQAAQEAGDTIRPAKIFIANDAAIFAGAFAAAIMNPCARKEDDPSGGVFACYRIYLRSAALRIR
jgi:hypothetical protein